MQKNTNYSILAIDIGGTGLKMITIGADGQFINERSRILTPRPATPQAILQALIELLKTQPQFDRVAAGFPGVVMDGITINAPNLDPSWKNFPLQKELEKIAKKPCKIANDADIQGYGDITGRGVELVITLGTGMGSALFVDGVLVPNLELGHHPFKKDKSYEEILGKKGLKKHGVDRWNTQLARAIKQLRQTFNYTTLYLGGGNAKKINIDVPKNVKICDNSAGLLGGVYLWQ